MNVFKIVALFYGFLLAGAAVVAVIITVVHGFGPPPDPAIGCRSGQSGRCFTRAHGVTAVEDQSEAVAVRYRDGLRTMHLILRGSARPEPGTRVLLERWNGDLVALYDPVTERRYRTDDWPVRWSNVTFVAPLSGALVLVAILVALGFALVRSFRI